MDELSFTGWLDAYGRAWEEGDAAAVVRLFADGAAYHETPFIAPMVGLEAIHAYWESGAGQSQRDVHFEYTVVDIINDLGIAHWRAQFVRVPSGVRVWLDGVLMARMDATGRCAEFREWWHREESPPAAG